MKKVLAALLLIPTLASASPHLDVYHPWIQPLNPGVRSAMFAPVLALPTLGGVVMPGPGPRIIAAPIVLFASPYIFATPAIIAGGTGITPSGGTTYTGTAPIVVTAATGVISCVVATASVPGCLAAADFTTFNGKLSGTANALTPAGGTFTLTGAFTATSKITAGTGFFDFSGGNPNAVVYPSTTGSTTYGFGGNGTGFPIIRAAGADMVTVTNVLITLAEPVLESSSTNKGSVTLNGDGTTASTVTVVSGAKCTVGDESGNGVLGNPGFSVTSTTLTIVNNAVNKTHVIDYNCH